MHLVDAHDHVVRKLGVDTKTNTPPQGTAMDPPQPGVEYECDPGPLHVLIAPKGLQEKAAQEKKKNNLQVSYNSGLFSLKVQKQFLTDVLQEVADQAHIPFAILTANGSQKEIDQVVTWNMSGVNFEELTNTWFPNGVRLYWRTDLASDVSKPLRLTIEDREEDAQAVQNVTP